MREERPGTGLLYLASLLGAVITPPMVWLYFSEVAAREADFIASSTTVTAWLGAGVALLCYGLLGIGAFVTRYATGSRPWLGPYVVLPFLPLAFGTSCLVLFPLFLLLLGKGDAAIEVAELMAPIFVAGLALALPSFLILRSLDSEKKANAAS